MGTAHEANPLVVAHPIGAVAAKWALVLALLAWHHRYASPIRAFGAVVWTYGAAMNLVVIGGL